MKKVLRFLVVAMLFAMTGTSFEIEAKGPKKSCSGRVKSDCKGSCEWRHGKCRDKAKKQSNNNSLKPAMIGMDASQAPANSIIIYNMVTNPPQADFTFYDANQVAITKPTTIKYSFANPQANGGFTNRPFVIVPANAKFMDVVYPGQAGDIIKVCDMQPLNISPSSLPYTVFDSSSIYAPSNTTFNSFSNSNAVITYNFVLNAEATPPIPGSGALLLSAILDKSDVSKLIPLQPVTEGSILADAGNDGSVDTQHQNQIFTPAAQFAGQGLVGYYYNDGTVKIFDPSGVNPQVYLFNGVVNMKTANARPINLTYIGRFKTPGWIQPTVYCSGCSNGTNNLYGNIVPRND